MTRLPGSLERCLVAGVNKRDVRTAAAQLLQDAKTGRKVLEVALSGGGTRSAKAAWILSTMVEEFGLLWLKDHLASVLHGALHEQPTGVRRELMRILSSADLQHFEEAGSLVDLVILVFSQPASTAAERYLALRLSEQLLRTYPELAEEICLAIGTSMEGGTDLYRKEAKRFLAKHRPGA